MLSTNLTFTIPQAETVLSRWLDRTVRCHQIEPLQGGMINTALRLTFDREPISVVIKLNKDKDSSDLRSERMRLDYLKTHTQLPVPVVYHYAVADAKIPYSYLLLETVPGVNMTQIELTSDDQITIDRELAEILIDLHGHNRDTYGPIHEPGVLSWVDIFVPELRAMRRNAEEKLPDSVLVDVDAAVDTAPDLLKDQGSPTLTHGDVWAGNIMIDWKGGGWHLTGLVDPSGSRFTDVEFELAYLQVFNTVGSDFMDIYSAAYPLRPGYELRRLYYWLNTHMIHVWLFDDRFYDDAVAEVARDILRYTR
ncbi:MAG: fructosamine kinase family protein [Gemmatimonadota bacterium]|nr:fructosamine kinase family protein [Gemmatimonadota bacterium]